MSADDQVNLPDFVSLTGNIVSAYVVRNSVRPADLADLIAQVHASLVSLGHPTESAAATIEKLTPAQIRKSITHDRLISFEDGKSYKTLRRHLTRRGLSPDTYRDKWGLPRDYPMTSASYSEQRSELARALGLGQQRRKPGEVEATPAPSKAARGRPRGKGATAEAAE